uniref:Ribosome biogenesis protein WDR12 homolog n=1 Tax=Caligus clemensi TaxID=344056 RepID=C1C311_CALCM|nr:WD repeat-containing protein 12 [Caligus clemensi]
MKINKVINNIIVIVDSHFSTHVPVNPMKIQVRFDTEEPKYAVPSTELSVPASIDPKGLNNLLRGLLEESGTEDPPDFSFIILNDLLKESLESFFASRESVSISEAVFEVRYSSKFSPPSPRSSSNHDDWVSSVSASPDGELALSACYDGTVSLWDLEKDERLLTIPAHGPQPAKSVHLISLEKETAVFASSGQDQTLRLYEYNRTANEITRVNIGKGHERSVDTLTSSRQHMASGSFDTLVKLWSPSIQSEGQEDEADTAAKKRKTSSSISVAPLLTLAGHKEAVSSLAFASEDTLLSASWDHTIKLWDLSISGMKSELVGNKSFFDISFKDNNVLAASADRFARIYDARSKASSIVSSTFTSHSGWVTSVDWCRDRDYFFVSGSHDKVVKMWDSRSFKTPLYDLSGHSERVLAVNWANRKFVISGGADNDMKVFLSNIM